MSEFATLLVALEGAAIGFCAAPIPPRFAGRAEGVAKAIKTRESQPYRDAISSLNSDVARIQTVEHGLFQARMRLQTQISAIFDASTPIQFLPVEILTRIFDLGYEISDDPCHFALCLTHVSRTWRSIAVARVSLWHEHHFDWPRARLELWQERYGPRVPVICAHFDLSIQKHTLKALQPVIKAAGNTPRFHTLQLHATDANILEDALISIICGNLDAEADFFYKPQEHCLNWSLLRHLTLSSTAASNGFDITFGLGELFVPAPHLESLTIRGPSFPIRSIASSLIQLHLDSVSYNHLAWVETFEACVMLERLELKSVRNSTDHDFPDDLDEMEEWFAAHNLICLPALKELVIHNGDNMRHDVACYLDLPSLKRLDLSKDLSQTDDMEPMFRWIVRACPAISALKLDLPSSSEMNHLLAGPSSLSHLAHLTLRFYHWDFQTLIDTMEERLQEGGASIEHIELDIYHHGTPFNLDGLEPFLKVVPTAAFTDRGS